MPLKFKSNPYACNYGKPFSKKVSLIVVHATAGASAMSTLNYLKDKQLSYHYIIERDGTIFVCAPRTHQAYHGGLCENAPISQFVNGYSIGIAFANLNDNKEKITEEQERSFNALVGALTVKVPTIDTITTHKAITKRKIDPVNWEIPADSEGKFLGLNIWR